MAEFPTCESIAGMINDQKSAVVGPKSPWAWVDVPWAVAALLGVWGAMIGIEEFTLANCFLIAAASVCAAKLFIEAALRKPQRYLQLFAGIAVLAGVVILAMFLTHAKKRMVEEKNAEIPRLQKTVGTLQDKIGGYQQTIDDQNAVLNARQSESDKELHAFRQESGEFQKTSQRKNSELADTARKQYALDLFPQIVVTPIDSSTASGVDIVNKGKTPIELTKVVVDGVPSQGTFPVQLSTGTGIHFPNNIPLTMQFERRAVLAKQGEILDQCQAYLETLDGKKYLLPYTWHLVVANGKVVSNYVTELPVIPLN